MKVTPYVIITTLNQYSRFTAFIIPGIKINYCLNSLPESELKTNSPQSLLPVSTSSPSGRVPVMECEACQNQQQVVYVGARWRDCNSLHLHFIWKQDEHGFCEDSFERKPEETQRKNYMNIILSIIICLHYHTLYILI